MVGSGYESQNAYQPARTFFLRALKELPNRHSAPLSPPDVRRAVVFSYGTVRARAFAAVRACLRTPLPTVGAPGRLFSDDRQLERLLEPAPLLIVDHCRILWRHMRLELISRQELEAKLRENGVRDLGEVEKAYVEADGRISVVKKK